ncbi:MAG: MlaE family ABC transporter permease [Pseudomonadota bacterium]
MTAATAQWLDLESGDTGAVLRLRGAWRLPQLADIARSLRSAPRGAISAIDGAALTQLDASAAALIHDYAADCGAHLAQIRLENFAPEHRNILALVAQRLDTCDHCPPTHHLGPLEKLGRAAFHVADAVRVINGFLGTVAMEMLTLVRRPRMFRMRETASHLETVGIDAIPIVMLVTFLIGVVFAYLLGIVISRFGVNIFVVDGVGLAMTRELSPIIVAIILAGRTGASFCAQLGTMKVTEEIDAIRTLGLSPIQVLVIPRLLAIVIALPLLTFLGDVMGILGGMVVADLQLGVTYSTFLDRLQGVLAVKHVWAGMVKAPVFAVFIALIGCRMGMAVRRDARSVGEATTSTVVQSIVAVILLDAAFAVFFVEMGI